MVTGMSEDRALLGAIALTLTPESSTPGWRQRGRGSKVMRRAPTARERSLSGGRLSSAADAVARSWPSQALRLGHPEHRLDIA